VTRPDARRSMRHYFDTLTLLRVIVVLACCFFFAFAIVSFMTPCEAATLCAAPVVATRPGLLRRLRTAWRAWWLRLRIASARNDLAWMREDAKLLPRQLAYTERYVEQLRRELQALELQQRRP